MHQEQVRQNHAMTVAMASAIGACFSEEAGKAIFNPRSIQAAEEQGFAAIASVLGGASEDGVPVARPKDLLARAGLETTDEDTESVEPGNKPQMPEKPTQDEINKNIRALDYTMSSVTGQIRMSPGVGWDKVGGLGSADFGKGSKSAFSRVTQT